jgi:hypothetical protein
MQKVMERTVERSEASPGQNSKMLPEKKKRKKAPKNS